MARAEEAKAVVLALHRTTLNGALMFVFLVTVLSHVSSPHYLFVGFPLPQLDPPNKPERSTFFQYLHSFQVISCNVWPQRPSVQ